MTDEGMINFHRLYAGPDTKFALEIWPNHNYNDGKSILQLDTDSYTTKSKIPNYGTKYQTFQMSLDCKKGEYKFYKNGTLFAHGINTKYKGCDVGTYQIDF